MGSDLQIVSEPEAAAMYALHTMDPHNIEVGDTFVVCDAGGGTVDLISYKVLALKPKLRIVEASTGTGYLCGSSFLNLIFQKFIENKLGHLEEWDEEVLEDVSSLLYLCCFRTDSTAGDEGIRVRGRVIFRMIWVYLG